MTAPKKERFLSLDVFRGLTIFLMILVNTAGPGAEPYAQLRHAAWFGFTLADLVFPSFLFAVGSAMSFALDTGMPSAAFVRKAGRRAVLIFLCGFAMYWYPFFHVQADGSWAFNALGDTRVMGVLQRIALCYLLAALLVRWLPFKALPWAGAALLLGHWAILYAFGQPGLELDKLGNAGTRLDLWLLGREHLYRKDGGFDPEGVLGTLPATANVLAGYLAGRWLQRSGKNAASVRTLLLAGAVLVALALAWNPWLPLSKKLWTAPFVLCTVGLDLLAMALLVWWVELRGQVRGSGFFTVLGRNPLAIYLFSELFVVTLQMIPAGAGMGVYDWIGVRVFQAIAPGAAGSLLCALAYTMACWAVGWWMDRRRLYLRL
ncbi:heparan-alpha-glucosaminide N-acetyltransferase domain-containing protein [Stenotrophomonas sp. MMGLT7]|uniref:acyltransferase family protein n=1 Tax=Stenotrophomonas sp. MMGLT7 TaxID=2901227 RepID=UPI001E5644B0|nr:heparan-alpha-glucosaminide N-acetyltransferase domain-containing protein [Stenotrophomonas sp. MMGLT7]MCD7099962.1 heparan-alpha-glucosaminide N-acetyltransferase domain-containing protein [Stenotrophomonas sp. MMGLT7]